MRNPNEIRSIFLVEDDPLVAHDVCRRLQVAGYTIAGSAASGEEALRTFPKNRSTLILMDVNLGDGPDGIEVASRFREQHDTPIVYLTAYSDTQVFTRAKATEPFGYIVKPFHGSMLEISVDLAFERYSLQRNTQARRLSEGQCRTVEQASDEALLRSLESLLCSPQFLDLDLGYDRKTNQFYAGCETAANLRDLITTVLIQHAPTFSNRLN